MCVAEIQKKTIFSKSKHFRAMVSIVVHGLFKEPIIEPLKSKMADFCHLDNRHDGWFDLDKISQTGAE